jgi:hypothetical protein
MAWINFMGPVQGGVFPTMMTNANPAPTPVAPSNRSWVPAVNPHSTGRAMAPYIQSEIVFRGDTRTPAVIEAAGGFWAHQAQAVGTGGTAQQRDPHQHQAGPGNSIYVSCSRDLAVAKGFAFGFYVYVMRVNAGVDYNQYAGGNALQAEVMAVEGIRLQDVIAVRHLNLALASGTIQINNVFQQAGMTQAAWLAAVNSLSG